MTENEPSIKDDISEDNDDDGVKTGQDDAAISDGGFDDDDFGDFEEAAPVKATYSIEEPDDPFPESPKKLPEFGFANFAETPPPKHTSFDFSVPSSSNDVKTLQDLVEDSEFWKFDDSGSFSLVENDEPTVDYFEFFDTGKYDDENPPDLPKDYQEALKLWSEVCFVEDTPALKLQWNKTTLYSSLLSTLNMSAAKAMPRDKPVVPVLIPTSGVHLELPTHDRVSKLLPSANDQEKSDSQQLSESGATENDNSKFDNFDWHPSSLDTACISDVLNLNFETNHKNTDDSFEKELQRLGIERSEIGTPDTQDSMVDNNSLNLNEILRPTMTGRSETNGIVSELSADARSLLNALPDYGYMLSKILMFPVKR
uniref:Aftiphilin clathrin-binding box domain-containing protein n=1 Tax=Panagrolaimus sp. JU765 TaxID=591449 RepID=A0AC34Q2V2_9BILA